MDTTVKLTVQIRDLQNRVRVTTHNDVNLKDVGKRAQEIADRSAVNFRREKKHTAEVDG